MAARRFHASLSLSAFGSMHRRRLKTLGSKATISPLPFPIGDEYHRCLQNKEINTEDNCFYFLIFSYLLLFSSSRVHFFGFSLSLYWFMLLIIVLEGETIPLGTDCCYYHRWREIPSVGLLRSSCQGEGDGYYLIHFHEEKITIQ